MPKLLTLLALSLLASLIYCSTEPLFLQGRYVYFPDKPYNVPQATAQQHENALKSMNQNENPFEKSGHILINKQYDSHLYYLFFESQEKATSETPLILWLQGGPGCSSMTGAFGELGPYHVNEKLELVPNPYSWNKKAHLLFIDNPVGAGFSYTNDRRGYPQNEDEVAEGLYAALLGFYEKYPQYKNNPFFITGESYAGKYVPALAYKIQQEKYQVPLKAIAIGDGLTHPITQFTAYDEFAFANALIGENDIAHVKQLQNQTATAIQAGQWDLAMGYTDKLMSLIVGLSGGINVYDIRAYGNYDFSSQVKYMNLPEVKKMMHTEGRTYHDCDGTAYQQLAKDMPQTILPKVESLLREQRIKLLFYSGMFDLIITSAGTSKFLRETNWKYQDEFKNAVRRIWKVKDEQGRNVPVGWIKSVQTLTHVTVHNAGHMAPMDQPLASQTMIYDFINGKL